MDNQKEQFSSIYDQYIEKIYRFVYLKVNSQEIAEDITSKVFLKGWEAFKNRQNPIENPGAFLYQIARNDVVDYYRHKGRNKVVSAEISPEMVDQTTDEQAKAIMASDINMVKSALTGLKKDYQDIIIWHYLDDMPVEEIAKLVGRPEGTVRVMLHRGLKDLKELIKES